MDSTFWNIKVMWWAALAIGLVAVLIIRHFMKKK